MPRLGAHLSIKGGFHRAVESAYALGMEAVQIFTHSPQMWPAADGRRVHDPNQARRADAVRAFHEAVRRCGIQALVAHASYLINLGAADEGIYQKSITAFVVELQRAEQLGLQAVVVHPGGHGGAGEEAGIDRVVSALDEIHRRCPGSRVRILLETTAGQGNTLGHRFDHLGAILRRVRAGGRLGVCLDTCHVFAAGYPLAPSRAYQATMRDFDRRVGLERIEAFHLNDSAKPLGSRVDRHAGIGRGQLGPLPFRLILNDRRFQELPMILETPKGMENGRDLDQINLEMLRRLITQRRHRARSRSGRAQAETEKS